MKLLIGASASCLVVVVVVVAVAVHQPEGGREEHRALIRERCPDAQSIVLHERRGDYWEYRVRSRWTDFFKTEWVVLILDDKIVNYYLESTTAQIELSSN